MGHREATVNAMTLCKVVQAVQALWARLAAAQETVATVTMRDLTIGWPKSYSPIIHTSSNIRLKTVLRCVAVRAIAPFSALSCCTTERRELGARVFGICSGIDDARGLLVASAPP